MNQPATTSKRRVLVVEDDLTSREYLRLVLEKSGYSVSSACDVNEAQRQLLENNFETFDCVVTDLRMPGQSGLDLLAWLKKEAPPLATIILTAEGERQLVTESLRGGAVDFLEKPVSFAELRESVHKAIGLTDRRRHATQVESAVKDLGRTQNWMLHSRKMAGVDVHVSFHPMLEAGGDFFNHFQPAPDKYFCLLTDVSGHDLKAGYISAYFQGVVRGMLERGAAMSDIFATFNRLLVEEWNQTTDENHAPVAATTSIAACSLIVDFRAHTAGVLTSGIPAAVWATPDGRAQIFGEGAGSPLGWFADYTAAATDCSITKGGMFLLWTDGLEDLAERHGVTPLSLGFTLETADAESRKLKELEAATDDVLFAAVRLPAAEQSPAEFQPLVVERHRGSQMSLIDDAEARWSRSLQLAIEYISNSTLHDVLLASREALINALKHGCRQRDDCDATFQISFDPERRVLRVRVEDSGSGHTFDAEEHERSAGSQLVEAHRGLMLMHHLASHMTSERNGASVTMDFDLNQPSPPFRSAAAPASPQHNPASKHVSNSRS